MRTASPQQVDSYFSTTQDITAQITVWDTPLTVVSKGIVYRPGSAKASFGSGINLLTASRSALNTHLTSNVDWGLTTTDGSEVQGRIPVIHAYWGTGSPIGSFTANRGVIHYSGTVKKQFTGMVLLGRGKARVFRNGTSVLSGTDSIITETTPRHINVTFNIGDTVDIYFWTINETWGGLSVRIGVAPNPDGSPNWQAIREATVLSASWMDDGQAVPTEVLRDVVALRHTARVGSTPELQFELALTDSGEPNGWTFDPSLQRAVHNGSGFAIRVGQRVQISKGLNDVDVPEFTGAIEELTPSRGVIRVRALGYENRLAKALSENYPDRLSYAAWGYIERDGVENPVWNVPAYDHWPYEHAIYDLCLRAWIDSENIFADKTVWHYSNDVKTTVERLFRCRSLSGEHIRISRQSHYGNPDGDPDLPADDPYITPSELTETVYQRIIKLVNRIGYDFRFDGEGNVVLAPVNNASAVVQITGGTQNVHPGAIGGTYRSYTGTNWSYSTQITAARAELVVVRGPTMGSIRVQVVRTSDSESIYDEVHNLSYPTEVLYYDRKTDINGVNLCVLPVLSGQHYDTYTITVTPSGASAEYGLDAIRTFSSDPFTPSPAFLLRTFENTLDLNARSNASDRLNDAVVVGARQQVITDSAKAGEQGIQEYVVSRAQDVHSILNPNAHNYIGVKVTSFLSDESIADQDLADWASTTLVTQFRLPQSDATIQHTALPILEVRDPIYVLDDATNTFDGNVVMWVTGYTTDYTFGERPSAITSIDATAFPAVPSYEPQEEIDISLYNNKPVINLNISYMTLTGQTINNPGKDLPIQVNRLTDQISVVTTVQSDTNGYYITIPNDVWSPGSEILILNSTGQGFKNNPYYTYYERASATRLNLVFRGGSGEAVYGASSYLSVGNQVTFRYLRISDKYSGQSPFYDPYTSENNPPNLVNISFDNLVKGYYRVSIVDARDRNRETTVAWLTEPGVDDPSGRNHWVYLGPGKNRTFRWDGVDNIGEWNRKQTENSISRTANQFPELAARFQIGAGFYAHNDITAPLTHISSEAVSGTVVYPVGKYSQFYVKIECRRPIDDTVLEVRSSRGSDTKESAGEKGDLFNTTANEISARFIYMHLPPTPNRATIDIQDWNYASAGAYTPGGNSWSNSPDTNATIRDEKPVRIQINPVSRLGSVFAGGSGSQAIKVHRVVHLLGIAMDQSVVFFGEPWNDKSASEEKRVISRRTVNDSHTVVFADSNFEPSEDVDDWVFYPSLFRDEFLTGEGSIRYLDYKQLFEVPHWNPNRRVGEKRSRFNLGYMAYLFYFSVFTQDRSGRLVWAIDPTHVDRSKILTNTTPMQWPFDLDRHQRRVIYVRQWWDSALLDAELGSGKWNIPNNLRGAFSDRFDGFDTTSRPLYPLNNGTTRNGVISTTTNSDAIIARAIALNRMPSGFATNRQWGNTVGNWTVEGANDFRWYPSPSRDFHPFYVCPPMGIASRKRDIDNKAFSHWETSYALAVTDFRYPGGWKGLKPNDSDESRFDTWFARVTSGSPQSDGDRFYPGRTVEDWFTNDKGDTMAVPADVADYQRIDEIIRYEDSRGGFSNGVAPARDLFQITGGDPYYLNPMIYRYFRKYRDQGNWNKGRRIYGIDVYERGWFSLTFRHTYVWESASLFPVDGIERILRPEQIDNDLTGWPVAPFAFDPGAWVGWKDDHPSAMQASGAFWESVVDCATIHWRYDGEDNVTPFPVAGGVCTYEVPYQALTNESLPFNGYSPNLNIFKYKVPPIGVGPRLPETRRVLFALVLVNDRRTQPVAV